VRKCDTVIRGGFILNVFTGEITREDVGIAVGRIAVVSAGDIEADCVVDAEGLILIPGLIDSHMHLESSMLTPAEFTRAALPTGTTTVIIDPHEIANVGGIDAVREMIEAARGLPLRFYFMAPPCVPASALDVSGAKLSAEDIAGLTNLPNVLGIAEVMDMRAVLEADDGMLEKLSRTWGKVIDGHTPGLSGRDLQAYIAAGISSDHESTNAWEGLEKLRAGMYLMIRGGSAAYDLDSLARLVNPQTINRCLLVTDDLQPTDIETRGHMNYLLGKMVRNGIAGAQAVRMATINAAQRFKLDGVGAIAPGFIADIVAVEDLRDFKAEFVISGGQLAAMDGEITVPLRSHTFSDHLTDTVHLPDLTANDLAIPSRGGPAQVIGAIEGQLITRRLLLQPSSLGEKVVSDTKRDILKIVVIERHGKSGSIGRGLVKGFGLRSGAIASSVAHDSHNVVAIGTNDADILHAIEHVGRMKGGLVVIAEGMVMADLPLPIGGLISELSAPSAANRLRKLEEAAHNLGCSMEHPFGTLSFMCLSVIPELKLTAAGLVDVARSEIVPLFPEERKQIKRSAAG